MAAKTWTQGDAADALRISSRQIRNLIADGVLTTREDGRLDPLRTALGYLAHVTKDAAGKAARTELAKASAAAKMLLLRKSLGSLVTLDELGELADDLWSQIWQAWQLSAAHLYRGIGGVDETLRLRVAGEADALGKSELVALRDRWRAHLRDRRVSLRDDERIEKLIGILSETDGAA